MKRFAISYISFFENEIKMGFVEAETYRGAIELGLIKVGGWDESDVAGYLNGVEDKDFGYYFFNGDFQCEALEA